MTALDVVEKLRSFWFTEAHGVTLRSTSPNATLDAESQGPDTRPQLTVYVGQVAIGGKEVLRTIGAETLQEVRYYNPSDAASKFGLNRTGGVIQLILGSR